MAQGWRVIWNFRIGLTPFTDMWHWVDPSITLGGLQTQAMALANLRLAASGLGVFFQGYVASNMDVSPIRSYQFDGQGNFMTETEVLNDPAQTGLSSFVDDNSDTGRSAIQMVGFANLPYPKRFAYYSGVPDSVVREGAPNAPANSVGRLRGPYYAAGAGAVFKTKWADYRLAIVGLNAPATPGPWGYRVRTSEATDPPQAINSYVTQAPGVALLGVVIANAGPAIAVNDRWQILRSRFGSGSLGSPNGHWEVANVVPASPTAAERTVFVRNSVGFDLTNVLDAGKFRKVDYLAVGCTDLVLGKQVSHKRGKPKYITRGRRSTRR